MDTNASNKISGYQRKYLRGLAHNLRPVVLVGRKGVTPALIDNIEAALMAHELIKVRFIDIKEREQKNRIITDVIAQTGCELAGTIGHTAILYRPNPDPDKRQITLPRQLSDKKT